MWSLGSYLWIKPVATKFHNLWSYSLVLFIVTRFRKSWDLLKYTKKIIFQMEGDTKLK